MREEPSAVTNLTQEPDVEGRDRKTEREAPESTRNLLEEKRNWR